MSNQNLGKGLANSPWFCAPYVNTGCFLAPLMAPQQQLKASLSCVNITAKNVETEDWTKKKAMYLFNLIGNMKRLFTKEQKYTRRNI